MKQCDLIIVGGGPAGLAAAISARKNGIEDILIIERDSKLGGILNQCIHNGFGLHTFKEELTGPEYAYRYASQVKELNIPYLLNTIVLDISSNKVVTAVNSDGVITIQAKSIVLAMGCRERPRGALNIPGYRPQGIYSAGTAQRLVNMEGFMPGKEVVILGSGDIGLIMARRLTLEGAKVKAVAELMPYSGGLKRNIVQCLDDFGIELKLSTTVVQVHGKQRLEGVTLAKVDAKNQPIAGTEEYIPCDTLLLSCGLIPENELSKEAGVEINPVTNGPIVDECLETSCEGVFACGNVLHVHDLVDFVSEEASNAGEKAAQYIKGETVNKGAFINVKAEHGVRYTVPSKVSPDRMNDILKVRFRVDNVYKNVYIDVCLEGKTIIHKKKQVVAPGEMEEVILTRKMLETASDLNAITITINEGETENGN